MNGHTWKKQEVSWFSGLNLAKEKEIFFFLVNFAVPQLLSDYWGISKAEIWANPVDPCMQYLPTCTIKSQHNESKYTIFPWILCKNNKVHPTERATNVGQRTVCVGFYAWNACIPGPVEGVSMSDIPIGEHSWTLFLNEKGKLRLPPLTWFSWELFWAACFPSTKTAFWPFECIAMHSNSRSDWMMIATPMRPTNLFRTDRIDWLD